MNIVIIGCGGVGGRVADLAASLPNIETLVLVDGDIFEERNADRQLGVKPGKAKTEALKEFILSKRPKTAIRTCPAYVGTQAADEFLASWLSDNESIVVMAVDNYAGRRRILESFYSPHEWPQAAVLVYGGNEFWDGHAIAQLKTWKGTRLDFRVKYPETLTRQDTFDPAKPDCTELAQVAEPQLVVTNATVAVLVTQFIVFYGLKLNGDLAKLVSENPTKPYLPVETWFTNGQMRETEKGPLRPE